MIYIRKDNSGYQKFPKPREDKLQHFIEVDGEDETRILAGERYDVNASATGVVFWSTSEVEAEKLVGIKEKKRMEVNAKFKQDQRNGFSYTFPDNTTGTVQVRNSDDKANINSLVTGAQVNPDGVFYFRDGENVVHTMTASEITAMGVAVQDFITNSYASAWAKKDEVDQATTINEVEAIVL